MSVQDTSIDAYENLIESGKLSHRKKQVLTLFIDYRELTLQEAGQFLKVTPSSITCVFGYFENKGYIRKTGKKSINENTLNYCNVYELLDKPEKPKYRDARKSDLIRTVKMLKEQRDHWIQNYYMREGFKGESLIKKTFESVRHYNSIVESHGGCLDGKRVFNK